MFAKNLKITIAHLYPKLLNIYGDRGNIITLVNRCKWRNIEVTVDSIDAGDNIDEDKYDIYFIGGGQDQQQIQVAGGVSQRRGADFDHNPAGVFHLIHRKTIQSLLPKKFSRKSISMRRNLYYNI